MCILVRFVLMLFVNVCHQWTCELKNVEFLVGLVPYCDADLCEELLCTMALEMIMIMTMAI